MPVVDRSVREDDLQNKLEQARTHRNAKLRLENKILEVRLERAKLLREHYKDHWLKVELRHYESKMESIVSRSKYTVYQTARKRVDDLKRRLVETETDLDKQIAELQRRLDQYKKLDGRLLSEYRGLKEDLECQNLLIEMSGGNGSAE